MGGVTDEAFDATLKSIAPNVHRGRCVLFFGAGIHAPPPPDVGIACDSAELPPMGGELSRMLAEQCGLAKRFPKEDASNLLRVAQYFESQPGLSRQALVAAVRAAVETRKKPSALLRALAALPFRYIVTTNFDTLFEQALHLAGKRPFVAQYKKGHERADEPDEDPEEETPFLFKIHGSIDRPESLVITDEDYIDFLMRMGEIGAENPVPRKLLYQLAYQPMLFLGYSLRDYNLRLLFKTVRKQLDPARLKPYYAIDPYPDEITRAVWEDRKLMQFVVEDGWRFVLALEAELSRVSAKAS